MRRWRKTVLWIGCTLSVLIAVAFIASARWQVAFQFPSSRGPAMMVMAGSVILVNDDIFTVAVPAGSHSFWLSKWNAWSLRRLFWLSGGRPNSPPSVSTFLEFPLYAVFLAVLLPTLLVRRFVPKFPCGHCRRCGYNLTGLTEARCPECGAGFVR